MPQSTVSIVIQAIDQASGKLDGVIGSFTEFRSALELVGQGVQKLEEAYAATISETAEYGKQVRDLSVATGAGAEETSKLIQVADDAEVGFSALRMAARVMNAEGVQPTIENIARLADEYNAMADPIGRAEFLMRNFGEAGIEMGKLLEQGGQAIRDGADAAERMGMVMDERATQAATDYRVALDGLQDAVTAVQYKIGNTLIPTVTQLADTLNLLASWNAQVDSALAKNEQSIVGASASYQEYVTRQLEALRVAGKLAPAMYDAAQQIVASGESMSDETAAAYGVMTEAAYNAERAILSYQGSYRDLPADMDTNARATERVAGETQKYADAVDALRAEQEKQRQAEAAMVAARAAERMNRAYQTTIDLQERVESNALAAVRAGVAGSFQQIEDRLSAARQLAEETAADQARIDKMQARGWTWLVEGGVTYRLKDLREAVEENAEAQERMATDTERATAQLIYQQAAAGLDARAALELARALGLVDEDSYNAATTIQTLNSKLEDTGNLEGYKAAMIALNLAMQDGKLTAQEIKDILAAMDGQTVNATVHITATGDTGVLELPMSRPPGGVIRPPEPVQADVPNPIGGQAATVRGGETVIYNIYDQAAAALAMAQVSEARRQRANRFMGQ